MADEIKEFEPFINNNGSVKKIKEPDFSEEVLIDRIHLLPKHVFEQHFEMMKKTFPDVHLLIPNEQDFTARFDAVKKAIPELNPEQIEQRIYNEEIANRINSLIIRDAIFDKAMKTLVPCFEINVNQNIMLLTMEGLRKNNPNLASAPYDYVQTMAARTIEKELIFAYLAKEWNITVNDEDARKVLMNYYHATNNSIRDKINDPAELEKVKNQLMEQTIANRICSLLKYRVDMKAINQHAEEDKMKALELMKQEQELAAKTQEASKQQETKTEADVVSTQPTEKN